MRAFTYINTKKVSHREHVRALGPELQQARHPAAPLIELVEIRPLTL